MTDKNCFLHGYFAGLDLKRGARAAPLSVRAYNKADFLAGLAVGLTSPGTIIIPSTIIGSRESSTDEMLCELYLRDLLGQQTVPKIPGMTDMQTWMQEQGWTDPSEYAERREAYGSDIAWDFYGKAYAIAEFDDDTQYPVDVTRLLANNSSWNGTGAGSWRKSAGSILGDPHDGFAGALRVTGGTGWRQAVGTTLSYSPLHAACYIGVSVPGYRMPSGNYRLRCTAGSITPPPIDWGPCKQGMDIRNGYGEIIDKSSGVTKGGSLEPYGVFVPVGEWVEFHYDQKDELLILATFSRSTWGWSPLPDYDPYMNNMDIQTNTETTQRVEYTLELLERDQEPLGENATLSQVMRAAENTGKYFLSTDGGETLKPPLVIDQENAWTRDFPIISVYEERIFNDVHYATGTSTQINQETYIQSEAPVTSSNYIATFSDYDSSFVAHDADMPVGKSRMRLRPSGGYVWLQSRDNGQLGYQLSKSINFTIRKRE